MKFEKIKWTDEDFENMGWQYCKIYAIAFNEENFEFLFDIDYIFKAVDPENGNAFYSFWVSPATLIFKNVYDIKMDAYSMNLDIQEIAKENPQIPKNAASVNNATEYDWVIETSTGEITFKSIGYTQVARKSPKLFGKPAIGLAERGGIAFDGIIRTRR